MAFHESAGNLSFSTTLAYLIRKGLDAERTASDSDGLRDYIDSRIESLERAVAASNAALVDQSAGQVKKVADKVSAIQKQAANASVCAGGNLAATVTVLQLVCSALEGPWNDVTIEQIWRVFRSVGKNVPFEQNPDKDLYHAFRDAERAAGAGAGFATLYCGGDASAAASLMGLDDDRRGFDALADRTAREMRKRNGRGKGKADGGEGGDRR